MKRKIYNKLLEWKEVSKGTSALMVENVVAQMLVAAGHKLFFYSKSNNKDAEDRMEIDFLVRKSKITNRHNISPIEVKSGDRYSLTSLEKCIRKYGPYLSTLCIWRRCCRMQFFAGFYKQQRLIQAP